MRKRNQFYFFVILTIEYYAIFVKNLLFRQVLFQF